MLAPIVMGYLGKRLSSGSFDAGALGGLLGGEREQVRQQDPGLGGIFDLLGGNKDEDDDGGLMDMAGDSWAAQLEKPSSGRSSVAEKFPQIDRIIGCVSTD